MLKEIFSTCENSLPISAVWLKINPEQNKKGTLDYNLIISADFDAQDIDAIKPVLQKHKLEMKKEDKVWVIFDAKKE